VWISQNIVQCVNGCIFFPFIIRLLYSLWTGVVVLDHFLVASFLKQPIAWYEALVIGLIRIGTGTDQHLGNAYYGFHP
jgi:hypothetical protein